MPTVIEELANHITTHQTATGALNEWCTTRIGPNATGIIVRVLADEEANHTSYSGPLVILKGERLRYRIVQLIWGEITVSEAENWYLPDRLPLAMQTKLLTGNTPFGDVVRSLSPQRTTVAVYSRDDLALGGAEAKQCMDRLTQIKNFSSIESFVLHIRAIMTAGDCGGISDVFEHYRQELIDQGNCTWSIVPNRLADLKSSRRRTVSKRIL